MSGRANDNAITITDVDAGGGSGQVKLFVDARSGGAITLSTTSGITFLAGSNGASWIYISGTIDAVNAALEGMTVASLTSNYSVGSQLDLRLEHLTTVLLVGVGVAIGVQVLGVDGLLVDEPVLLGREVLHPVAPACVGTEVAQRVDVDGARDP